MSQSLHQRHALTAYNIVQASKRHDMRAGEAEYCRPQRLTANVRRPVSQPSRAARCMVRVVAFCDWFANNGWVLIIGIAMAFAIFAARANGVMQ